MVKQNSILGRAKEIKEKIEEKSGNKWEEMSQSQKVSWINHILGKENPEEY